MIYQKKTLAENKQIEIYQSDDGQTQIQVRLKKDTIWLSQAQMAELFDKDSDTIGLHLRNIYKSGELKKSEKIMNSICIFLGSNPGADPVYARGSPGHGQGTGLIRPYMHIWRV